MYKRVVSKPGRRRSIGRQATKALNRSLTSPEKSPANVKSCIKVVVRVRPENERELQSNQRTIVRVIDENMLIFDPVEESADVFFHGQKLPYRDITKRQNKDLKFMFDHVFGPDAANEQLFEHTTKDLINNLLNGYNCSVFAYGATGSGKTYTMLGSEDNPGIVFMTMMELYKRIEEVKEEKQFDVSVSYLEVYNETIRDLLTPCTGLQVREDPQRGVVISGLSSHKPRDAHDLLNMLQFGNRNRTQHPTDANAESSRSHAIFQVCVKQQDRTAGLSSSVRFAKMSLIDLAGSERASIVTKCNERFREGANINKSLLALGNCINALADRKTKGHVPYRNSKLTHILKDSLGGNCNTVMISAVSPSLASFEDTYNTLKYADRAKSIRLNESSASAKCHPKIVLSKRKKSIVENHHQKVKRNVLSVDAHISKYAKIVDDLRKEIAELKQKIKTYESEAVVSSPTEMMDDDEKTGVECTCGAKQDSELQVVPAAPPSLNIDDVTRIEKLFANNKTLRSNVLKFESSLRNIEVQMHFRRSRLEHFAALDKQEGRLERSAAKVDLALRALEDRCRHVTSKKQEVETTLEANKKEIEELKTELLNTYTGALAEHLQEIFKREELEAEKAEMQVQFSHMQEMGAVLEKENANTERLLVDALNLVRMQQSILNGHGFLTTDLLAMFESLVKQSQAPKEVTWADQTPPPPLVMYQSFLYLPTIASTMPKHGQPPKALSVVEPGFKAEDDVARTAGDNDIMTTPPKPVRLDTTFAISPSSRSRACKSLSNLFISENDNLPEPPSESSPLAIKGQADSKPNWFLLSASPQCSVSVSRDEERTPQKILNMTFSVEQVDEETKGECSMVSVQQSTKSYPTTGQNESPSTPPLPKLSCTMTFKVETPRAPKPLSLQSAQTLALPSTSSSTLDDGDDKDVKVPLNTSYTISESSLDAADCPSTCVTVAATKTGKPPSILMQQQPSSAKKSAGMKTQYPNSPFRALTPRNDVNKNATKRETFKVSFKTNDSFKSYMSTTAASRGKVRHHRWHSSVKENTAPYVVQKWHRNSLRATSSDSEKERIRPSWGILKKKSQSSTSIR